MRLRASHEDPNAVPRASWVFQALCAWRYATPARQSRSW